MPIYSKRPKVTITFIRRSKSVVQEMYGLVCISDFESINSQSVLWQLVLSTMCMGRFKFMVNFSLIKYQ